MRTAQLWAGGWGCSNVYFGIVAALVAAASPAAGAASLTAQPVTWNVIGLDSNDVTAGPNHFPVGARVCNSGNAAASNVTSAFVWDSANPNVALRPGTLANYDSQRVPSLAPGACHDFYYEVEVTRTAAAYATARRYHVTAAADSVPTASTPVPRELYVERLVSQSRNHILGLSVDGVPIPDGGTMTLLVGRTYTIRQTASTATNGYEQLASFLDFPNTIFEVLAVSTTYTADTSGPVASPNDKLYGDACTWDDDPDSPYYRSCRSVGKVGGGVEVTYQVRILEVPQSPLPNPEPIGSLIYDFSGSSYHYNSDFDTTARFAAIVDPTTLALAKNFSPSPTSAGGISVLGFTIANPNPVAVAGLSFSDTLPASPGAMVIASPNGAVLAGCGAPTLTATPGAGVIAVSGATVAANGTCTIRVNVSLPVAGTYDNTSGHLFAAGVDTGSFATGSLTVDAAPPPPPPVCGITLATWNFASGFTLAAPEPYAPGTSVTASAAPGAGLISLQSSQNHTTTPAATVSWGSNGAFDSTGALDTANNDYFQFAVDTTELTSASLSFWARRPNGNAPRQVLVYYGTSASPPGTLHTTLGNPPTTLFPAAGNSWESSGTVTFASGLNPAGPTYFRIYGAFANNNNPGSDLYLDDVVFTGCLVPRPPTLAKAFNPALVVVGGTSNLTFTITNPRLSPASGISFSDLLPAGLTVTSGSSSQCGGTLTRTAPATLSFTGGSLGGNASCTVTATVTATTAGPHANLSGFVSSTESGQNTGASGVAGAVLTAVLPPALVKAFAPDPILATGTSTLTFTIRNPNNDLALGGVAFSDTLPTSPGALVVAAPPAATTSGCGSPTFAPAAGAGSLVFSGGAVAAGGSCTVTVDVTAPVGGTYANTAGPVTHLVNGSPAAGNSAAATLDADPGQPRIGLLKEVGPSAAGPWSYFRAVAAGAPVYYRFTVENLGNVPLSAIVLSDPQVNTASCSWPASLPVASPTAEPAASCVVGPLAALAGSHANTATASGSFAGTTVGAGSTAVYATPALALDKTVAETSFGAAGDVLHYSFTVTSSGSAPLAGPVAIADDRAADESCPPVASVPDFDNFLDPGESLVCTATYTVTAADVAFGVITNVATASADGTASNSDSVSVPLAGGVSPPTLDKAFVPATVAVGEVGTLTFTAGNPNAAIVLNGVAFTDSLPAGLEVANPPNAATSGCGSPAFAPAAGATSLTFSGGTIAGGGTCTVAVAVVATQPGAKNNQSGAVSSSNGGAGNGATAILTVLAPPTLAKVFTPAAAAVGGVVQLSFTVGNPNGATALAGVAFSDPLPAGLAVASPPNAGASGCGGAVFAPAAGATSITLAGATVAAGGTCTVTVDVLATTAGIKTNLTGGVSSTNGGSGGGASATLAVGSAPGIAKAFAPATVAVGELGTLTFTLTNPNPAIALAGVAFGDALPAGLVVATPPNAATSGCGSPTFAPAASDAGLAFSGGAIAAGGTCTATVDVLAATPGAKNNVSSAVTSANGGTGNSAAATLEVLAPPALAKAFTPSAVAVGGTVALTFTLDNPNLAAALVGVAFADPLPAGLAVASPPAATTFGCGSPLFAPAPGDTTLAFSGGTIAAGGSCSVTVDLLATGAGIKTNLSGQPGSSNGGTGGAGSATLSVGSAPGIAKSFAPNVVAVGEPSRLTFTITNPNPAIALTGVAFGDPLPAGLAVAAPAAAVASGCGSPAFTPAPGDTSLSFSGGAIAAGGECTVAVDVVAEISGSFANTSSPVGAANGGQGNSASATLVALAPPRLEKSFAPAAVPVGGTSTLTLVVENPNPGAALAGISWSDPLPAGLAVASPADTGTAGCGAATFAPAPGDTTLTFAGGTIAAGGSCTASVRLVASAAGLLANVTSPVSSQNAGSGGGAAATLAVGSAPGIAKTFTPDTVAVGGRSTLAFTLANPNAAIALTGVAFGDPLPAGLAVAAPPAVQLSGCGSPLFAPAPGDTVLAFGGGTIAAGGSCRVSLEVEAATPGEKANFSGRVSATNGGEGNSAAATLSVLAPPAIAKSFSPRAVAVGAVAVLSFVISNPNPGATLFGVAFTDALPPGLAVALPPNAGATGCGAPVFAPAAGDVLLDFSGATLPPGGECTVLVEVVAGAPGIYDNTTGVVGSANGGSGDTGSATLAAGSAPGMTKAFAPAVVAPGERTTLTFTIGNPNPAIVLTGVAFGDPLPAGLAVAAPPNAAVTGCGIPLFAPAAGDAVLAFSGGTIAAGGSCVVSVDLSAATPGARLNTSDPVRAANGGTGSAASATLTVLAPPVLAKEFVPNAVAVGGTSTLTFSAANPNPAHALAGVGFSDDLPAGLAVASPPNAGTSGCGAASFAPAPGATSLSLAGAAIAAGGSCIATVDVVASTAGVKNNVSSNVVTANAGSGGSATAALVVGAAPAIAKSFSPAVVAIGATTRLSFTLSNPNAGLALTGVAFGDSLPAGLAVASPPNAATSGCGAPSFAPAAGDTVLAFSGATLAAAGACIAQVDLTATAAGPKNNVSGVVSSANGGSGNSAAATLEVLAPPALAKAFAPAAVAVGGLSTLTLTVVNPNPVHALLGVAFNDPLPPGLAVAAPTGAATSGCGAPSFAPGAGDTALAFAGGTVPAGGTCTVTVDLAASVAGVLQNVAGPVLSSNAGQGNAASASLVVGAAPGITKEFVPDQVPVGGTSRLRFGLVNPNPALVLTGVAFGDPLPAGLAVASPPDAATSGCGAPGFTPAAGDTALAFSGGAIAAAGTCTVEVDVVALAAGAKNNVSGNVGSANGGQGNSAAATLEVLAPPRLAKAFAPNAVAVGGTTRLTFTVENPNPGQALTGVAFSDPLPAGLAVAAAPAAAAAGCGAPSFAPAAGDTTLVFTGGTVAAGGACVIGVDLVATAAGTPQNTTGPVASANGGQGNSASASLVAGSAPGIAKAFVPAVVAVGEASRLRFTLTNPNAGLALTGVTFADPLPAGLAVAAPPAAATSGCGAPTFAPAAGDGALAFSGGTIAAAASCTVEVDVVGLAPGLMNNVSGNVGSANGGPGNAGAASLLVLAPPQLDKAFAPTAVSVGGVVTLTLAVGNPNRSQPLLGIAWSDPLPAGLTVAAAPNVALAGCGAPSFAPAPGATTLSFAGGTVAPGGTCVAGVDLVAATAGLLANLTTPVGSSNAGQGNTAAATLTVGSAPGIAKQFVPDPVAVGGVSTLRFTLTNPNAALALTGVAFGDPLPAGLAVAAPPNAVTSGCGAPVFAPAAGAVSLAFSGGVLAPAGSCTVQVDLVAQTPGLKSNLTSNVVSANGGAGNAAAATLAVLAPPRIAKSFAPAAISVGETSTLSFTLTNPNATVALAGVAFGDPLPAGLAVASPPNVATSGCGAPSFAPAAGDTVLAFAGGMVAAGSSCIASVAVTATTPGLKNNLTGNVGSSNAGAGNAAGAVLAVGAPGSPLVSATKDSTFDPALDDLDGSGGLSPGDTLLYTVEIANSGDADALGLRLTDQPDAHTALLAGSVAASQGSVVQGNAPGDTVVEVDLGTLPAAGGAATITFRVRLAAVFPAGVETIANQGEVSGGNVPPTPTDDPGTAPGGDPTVDVVDVAGVVVIPSLAPWGLLVLALALAAAALRRLG